MDSPKDDPLVEEMLAHLKTPESLIDSDDTSPVTRFYAGRSVFITGATGFIGKVLVEKLVRSCPGVKTIYLLIRDKRGKAIDERLRDLISSPCFDRIRELNGGSNKLLEQKLKPIKGDITLPKLGISRADMSLLANECSVVFNSAATIRFVEPLDAAVRNNVYSIGQLVEVCDELKKLEVLMHLSTAYSNCHKRDTIYEIFYEPPMGGDQILKAVEEMRCVQEKLHVYPQLDTEGENCNENGGARTVRSRDRCDQQRFYEDNFTSDDFTSTDHLSNGQPSQSQSRARNKLAGDQAQPFDLLSEFTRIALRRSNRPNTYTFTKAISENYLLERVKANCGQYLGEGKVAVGVVRPSIVGGAWREPLVGMVDNFNGPTGTIMSVYTGNLRAMPGSGQRVADIVPVDMVSNMILAAAWYLGEERKKKSAEIKPGQQSELAQIESDHGVYIFNFVSGNQNPILWAEIKVKLLSLTKRYPPLILTGVPNVWFIKRGKFYEVFDSLVHRFPALAIDFVKRNLLGQQVDGRTSAYVGYTRIRQMTDTLTPFTSNQWRLCDDNTRLLFERLDQRDKDIFHFDIKSIDWSKYLCGYIIGSRTYALKDDPKRVPKALQNLKRNEMINSCLMAMLMFAFFYFIVQHMLRLQAGGDL